MTIRKKNGILLMVILFQYERSFSLNTQKTSLHKLRYFFLYSDGRDLRLVSLHGIIWCR